MVNDESRDSVMNIAKKFLDSIQANLNQANNFFVTKNYPAWHSVLDCLYRKCLGRMIKDEVDKIMKIRNGIGFFLLKYNLRTAKIKKNNSKINPEGNKEVIGYKSNYINHLSLYEEELIKVLDRIGWLVPTNKSIMDIID